MDTNNATFLVQVVLKLHHEVPVQEMLLEILWRGVRNGGCEENILFFSVVFSDVEVVLSLFFEDLRFSLCLR